VFKPVPDSPVEQLVAEYRTWLVVDRGLAAATVLRYENLARRFLGQQPTTDGGQLAVDLTAAEVVGFLLRESDRVSVGAVKGRVAELRSLLRFLHLKGFTPTALASAVPPAAGWHDTGIPVGLAAATHPSNCCSPTKPRPNRSLPGQPHHLPSHSTGDTGFSYCKPPTTDTASPPTTTPTYRQRSTPTPSPSPQPNSTLTPPGQNDWQNPAPAPSGPTSMHSADHPLANQQGPRRSRARYRAEMPVTGHMICAGGTSVLGRCPRHDAGGDRSASRVPAARTPRSHSATRRRTTVPAAPTLGEADRPGPEQIDITRPRRHRHATHAPIPVHTVGTAVGTYDDGGAAGGASMCAVNMFGDLFTDLCAVNVSGAQVTVRSSAGLVPAASRPRGRLVAGHSGPRLRIQATVRRPTGHRDPLLGQ
jgi:hypothetical protein